MNNQDVDIREPESHKLFMLITLFQLLFDSEWEVYSTFKIFLQNI